MLYSDPCRRFIRGTTIGDTSMRFWFFSRSHVFVTQAFDFISNPRPLIHYIISLIFSSLEDLGFDPTVQRVAVPVQESSGNNTQYKIQYDYHVGRQVYRTVECLSSFRAAGLISRGSRVWKVYRVGDPEDKYYALKDVWIPDDATTEGDIQRSLFENIQNSGTDGEDFKQHFVEIENCELVTCDGKIDKTGSFMRRRLPDQFHTFLIGALASSDFSDKGTSSQVTGSTIATPKDAPDGGPAEVGMDPRCRYSDKKHCRIIYKDVGTPLDSLAHPGDVLHALASATKGLEWMYKGGYVHRDLSGGNLIWMEGSKITKITDMEYSKKFLSDRGVGDRKTANRIFGKPKAEGMANLAEGTDDSPLLDDQILFTCIPHNFLHDLESLWWIGEHALLSSVPASGKVTRQQYQISSYKSLFPHSSAGSNSRTMFLLNKEAHDRHIGNLPTEYTHAAEALSKARRFLKNQYLRLEANLDFPHVEHSEFAPIYGLRSFFKSAKKRMYIYETTPLAWHRPFRSDSTQELAGDISKVAEVTGSVLDQEIENEEVSTAPINQVPSLPDLHEDEEDLDDIYEDNKARRLSLSQTSSSERPDVEMKTRNVPNEHGKRSRR
ncbi:uncharacterized protein EV420DRAFT_1277980 [Desarmillaria tabescens]|uniref:Fungal-type protein kinase domain-containing protein n=1 Tax=Armillaria tabescens TaxID=1929756 RepID=A0AA39JIE8_ARMTA|nr:uncharacterized protein EV420DRAFT_1277980 [Desarmillaria tabescens]KAK0443347.1 hypothetical protein EV420DRAFT_1277980 [Desarmillaria tabescens]